METQAKPLRLSTTSDSFEADFKARLHWAADTDAAIEQRAIGRFQRVPARTANQSMTRNGSTT